MSSLPGRLSNCYKLYRTPINSSLIFLDLSEPVDIFAEWIDAIDTQAKQKGKARERAKRSPAADTEQEGEDGE